MALMESGDHTDAEQGKSIFFHASALTLSSPTSKMQGVVRQGEEGVAALSAATVSFAQSRQRPFSVYL